MWECIGLFGNEIVFRDLVPVLLRSSFVSMLL